MITDLTVLSKNTIIALLEASGYNETSSDIIETEFSGVSNGNVIYKIKYYDLDENILEDNVYIFINDKGIISADY